MASNIPVLRLWVNPEEQVLRDQYKQHVENHNKHIMEDPHPNSGFDLLIPANVYFRDDQSDAVDKRCANQAKLVNHQIKAAMYDSNWRQGADKQTSCAYYLYPRSSIYKTPLMLANSVGIIDSGYRGWICSAMRFLPRKIDEEIGGVFIYRVDPYTKLTQICHPNLLPFLVELVDDESVLESTTRGEGGFGSTGV